MVRRTPERDNPRRCIAQLGEFTLFAGRDNRNDIYIFYCYFSSRSAALSPGVARDLCFPCPLPVAAVNR